jgi:penicillin-binding protein 1A
LVPGGVSGGVCRVSFSARALSASGWLIAPVSLNLDLQSLAEGVLARRLDGEGGKKKVGQGALVAMAPVA